MLEHSPENALRAAGGEVEIFQRSIGQPDEADGAEEKISRPLAFINPTSLMGETVPQMQWIVQDWLPIGYTTLNYGDGGVGKTLLSQQLMTSCATGKPWCGLAVRCCKVMGFFCEDDEAELHRRQERINGALGVYFDELADMRWASGVGEDNRLIAFLPDGTPQLMPRYAEILRAAKAFGAKLIVIDTAADTFGGNENIRSEVRQFIGHALNRLAREINGAVLLNAHPSRAGLGSGGDLDGGSTAWSNSARSRWSLVRSKGSEDELRDTNERILTRRKANYASIGDNIRLKWANGVLVPAHSDGGIIGTINREAAEETFLALLSEIQKQGRHVSESKNAGNFAPKVLSKSPNRQGHNQKDFERAMESLFVQKKIVIAPYGRPGDWHKHLTFAPSDSDGGGAE